MAEPFTREEIERLHTLVEGLLERELSWHDVPRLRYALARQRDYLERVYIAEGQREELMQALTAEVQRLRAVLGGEARPWEDPTDERLW